MTQSFTFTVEEDTDREDQIADRLVAHNKERSPRWAENHDGQFTASRIQIFALDAQGAVIGGVTGRAHNLRSWLEVSILWVDVLYRGQGLGRKLMARAEAEAIRRGCKYARLATSQYQAPGFYEKLGYVRYGTLEDCPPGDTCYYYRKTLTPVNAD